MKDYKLLVVEDDALMGRIVTNLVAVHFPEITVLPVVDSVPKAIEAIGNEKPNLVILDIQINEGTAFDVLNSFSAIDFKVIFMSGFHGYLVEALQFSAVEFVYKPFDALDMISAIEKALEMDKSGKVDYPDSYKIQTLLENAKLDPRANKIFLSANDRHQIVPIREIVYIKAELSKSVFFFLKQPSFEANLPLRRFEAMLKQRGFFRCHPHYLVNTTHILYVDPAMHMIHLTNKQEIVFEPRKYDELMALSNRFRSLRTNA
ncbi:MAG: LytTR family transcriptional regulator DNA-binding domain-containing protein [Breznakibacter sp.]